MPHGLKNGISIRTKLSWMAGGLVIGVAVLLSVLTAQNSASVLEREARQQLSQLSGQSVEIFSNFMKVRASNLDLWSADPLVDSLLKNPSMSMVFVPTLRNRLAQFREKEPWIENIVILQDNSIVYDDGSMFEEKKDDEKADATALLRSVPSTGMRLIRSEKLHLTPGKHFLVMKRAVLRDNNPLEGAYIGLILDLAKINETLFGKIKVGNYGFMTIAGEAEDRLVAPGQVTSSAVERVDFSNALNTWKKFSDIRSETGAIVLDKRVIPDSSVAVVGVASWRDVREPVQGLVRASSILGVVVSLAGILGALFFAGKLTTPIRLLTDKVRLLAAGDLDVRASITSQDEIGELSATFNEMAGDLKHRIEDIEFLKRLAAEFVNIRTMEDLSVVASSWLKSYLGLERIAVHSQSDATNSFVYEGMNLAPSAESQMDLLRFLKRPSTGVFHGYICIPSFGAGISTKARNRLTSLIVTVAENLELAIENISSIAESLQRVAFESEMKTAYAVQECLFTKSLPTVPGYDLGGYFTPAAQLGGDWYGVYYDESRKKLRLYIGDVTGHGVSSALITAGAMAVVHTIEGDVRNGIREMDLETIMHRLHSVIRDVGRTRLLMTFCICEIDIETGAIAFANAGHNAPFLLPSFDDEPADGLDVRAHSKKAMKPLMALGNRLGYEQADGSLPVYQQKKALLSENHFLVLYTDGLIEMKNGTGEEYGLARLRTICMRNSSRPAADMCQAVIEDFNCFRGSCELADDVSLVVLKRGRQACEDVA